MCHVIENALLEKRLRQAQDAYLVGLGSVEEVDASVEAGLDELLGARASDLDAEVDPGAKRDGRDPETRVTDAAVEHLLIELLEVLGGDGRHRLVG